LIFLIWLKISVWELIHLIILKKILSGNFLKEGWEPIGGMTLLGGIAAAMVGSVFSSVAWESVTFVSGEIDNPKKNVVKSMIYGTSAVMILYIAVNFVYLKCSGQRWNCLCCQ
jgi:APA family basic amino acid/polyamine antiporter